MIFTHSIRWRLQAWHALLLTTVIAGFGITAHRLASSDRLRAVDQELQSHVTQLGIAVPPSAAREAPRRPGLRPPPPRGTGLLDQIEAAGVHYAVWNADGLLQASSTNLPTNTTLPARPKDSDITFMRTLGELRQAVHFNNTGRCFLVGRPIQKEAAELHQLAWYLIAAGAGVLALGLLGGWWMASRAIAPITAISDTAEKIATGDLSRRIPAATSDDELGKLTSVLNSTFSRLDAAFTQQARFTADAAHELRTPVTAVLMHAQNGLATTPLTDEQREAFDACARAAQRMKRLIDSLLEIARLDAGQERMKHEPLDLAHVASDAIDLVQTLADARGITLDLQLDPAPCHGDAQRLGQVVINLLSNAIEHTRDRIRIETNRENGHRHLRVIDNGPGIAPEHLPHLFDRFYRADESRHGTQHNGLGLAISKAIVEAHGGALEATNAAEGGAVFGLRIT
ncbi:MAG: HAMP domain-containing histidine kinase [Verrucomicrobiaceae bacterium]|nr:HAMP domain-containing histidine kinase [Verrucomicrobiaceae bacterium]